MLEYVPSFRHPQKGMRRAVPGTPSPQTPVVPSYITATTDNKRVVTRDLYLRTEAGLSPGGDTIPRFGADGKMQFSTVSIDSGGSLEVPGSAVIQGNLTVNGLINGGASGGGGGGVNVAAGPRGNVTVSTTASVATVDLAPALSGVDISGDIDITGELEAKSLRILTGAVVDGALSAGSANIVGNAGVGGALECDSTITATGKIRSTGGDIEAITGILSGSLVVNGEATVGSLTANQSVTVAGNLVADEADIKRSVQIGGNVDVAGEITAAGLILRDAFVVDTLQVRGAATISGDLFVNSTIHHVGLFDPPIGGNIVLEGGEGISVTQDPVVSEKWTITYTGGGGGGSGGISGVNEGSNIEVLTSSDINPIVGVRINETLDMHYNKIANVDIIELVSTAMDTENPRVVFKDVKGVQRAQVEYNQDNQAEPLLLVEGPRVLIEASEADNVSGVTLATAENTLTVTNEGVDLAVPLLTMGGVEISVDGSNNMVIDNTNPGRGYKITSIPTVGADADFDYMLVYNVGTDEIRQTSAPMGTDICGGTNILIDKSTPEKPVVSLEVREDVDMGGKGLVFASSVGFSSGGSIEEGGGGSLRVTTKVGVNTGAGATPAQELEVNGGIQASNLFLTGMIDVGSSGHSKVLGFDPATSRIDLQDAGSGNGVGTVITAGKNIEIVGDVVSLAIDEAVDMGGQDLTNAATVNASNIDISGTVIIGSGANGNLRLTHQFDETYIESGVGRTTGSAAPLHFTDYNAQHKWMTIGSTGNVGIGKIIPQQALDVSGNITASGSVYGESLSTGGTVTATGNIISSATVSATRAIINSISLNQTASPSDINDMYYDGVNLYFRGMIVKMMNPASYIPGVNIEYFNNPAETNNSSVYTVVGKIPFVPFERSTYGAYVPSLSKTVSVLPITETSILTSELSPNGLCVLSGWFKPTNVASYIFSTVFNRNGFPLNNISFFINGSKYTIGSNISLTANIYYKIEIIYVYLYEPGRDLISTQPSFSWSGGGGSMFVNNTACC